MSEKNPLSEVEKETIVLCAVFRIINSTVNKNVLKIDGGGQTQVGFKTHVHFDFFFIMLVEFLSKPHLSKLGFSENKSYLEHLHLIVHRPMLGESSMLEDLERSISAFRFWLDERIFYENAWFSSIDLKIDIHVRRIDLIYIYGNAVKHDITRLARISERIQKIFLDSGYSLNLHQSMLIIEEFNEISRSVLHYHASTIAAFLNEIRWGVYEYLWPKYQKSVFQNGENPFKYECDYPAGLENEFARECFWTLMNKVRSEPFVSRFSAPEHLRMQW